MSSGSAERVSGGVSGGVAPARVLGVPGPADHQQTDAVIVVGAAIVRDARLLAQQRAFPEQLAGRWELPGGRVEPGESDRDAVVRECEEELGVHVVVHDQVGPDVPLQHGRMVLRIYAATLTQPEAVPVAREHRAVRWVDAAAVLELDWLDADLDLVPHLCDLLSASLPAVSAEWPSVVRSLVADLASEVRSALGSDLVGLYVYGSLVTGDFDERVSDVDLLAVTRTSLNDEKFGLLDAMHHQVAARYPDWNDRIEIAYFGADALEAFRADRGKRAPIAVISPGEPFHVKDAGTDWLLNWYVVRNNGLRLLGPPTPELFGQITTAELHAAVRTQMEEWREWVYSASHPGFQAYAILTACRGLYTHEHGEIVSKVRSAHWAKGRLPQWADAIDHALELRLLGGHVGHADQAETARFVNAVVDEINAPA